MSEYKIISDISEIELPDKFTCPICVTGKIIVEDVNEWEEAGDGTWQISDCGLHIDCSNMPDEPGDDWLESHWQTPYIDWLPLMEPVRSWINKHYRWNKP